MAQVAHDGAARPLARQERRGGGAQHGDVVEQVPEPFRPGQLLGADHAEQQDHAARGSQRDDRQQVARAPRWKDVDRKSTRLNSSHSQISYAVFCLKKKKTKPSSTLSTNTAFDSAAPLPSPPSLRRTQTSFHPTRATTHTPCVTINLQFRFARSACI